MDKLVSRGHFEGRSSGRIDSTPQGLRQSAPYPPESLTRIFGEE
ncbi:hypothetical protein AB4305_19515 [Nocardia sp. 2YAB30]